MNNRQSKKAAANHGIHELVLTRSVLLAHLFAGKNAPGDVIRLARRYTSVTHWEELMCAVINPKASRLMAIVSIRQLDGYSGILRRHGSIEYVRFFIDWGDGEGFRAVGLTHFKVCDAAEGADKSRYPLYHLVSAEFDADRYWESILCGIQPKVRAVLSWNQVPEMDIAFTPVFGNQVDSQICIDTEKELMNLFQHPVRIEESGCSTLPHGGFSIT
ncbi:MAG: hypothetical protein KZQ88_15555 [Candidatus Thiodiazotropha sp. (ex Dulcina madagascariensis)]|nr:hypothetical protein [Candidatus Thiodiazotropha sp. (ex Dulcina madagascariensis)]MCU7928533.1 hypothetical protein [Candidatus Thiodiazotropha sp. (ex Dulcina madagascariensis)]